MLLPLTTPEEMHTWDRETIETVGIPGVTLMESASREAVAVLLEEYGPVDGCEILCFAGSGNNGGDAFAMARQLHDLGADVTVLHTRLPEEYQGETRMNLEWAQTLGVPLKYLSDIDLNTLPQPDIVVDGLLGTGFQGTLRDDFLAIIRAMNRLGKHAFLFAIDIPSGLNGMTGVAQPEAVIADVTATFQSAKLGMAQPGANRYTGLINICEIGIPSMIQAANAPAHYLISKDAMHAIPRPEGDMHKCTAGHVLIIGGSIGLTGAAHLTAQGAMRSGAGLVTVAAPGGIVDAVKANVPEIMTLALGTGSTWTPALLQELVPHLNRFDTVVIGPGLGREQATIDFLEQFLEQAPDSLVIDADALYCLSRLSESIPALPPTAVLTPHPGEMAMLLETDAGSVQTNRLDSAEAFVRRCPATLVLKGAGTIVRDRDMTCISPFSEPNLSVGGSGDILAGIIGSLMARALPPMDAACIGVYWHGLAGRLLREDFPLRGNTASDIANILPKAAKESFACC